MVGHTGVLNAAIKAVEATDTAIGRISEACTKNDYTLVITADHGNAEQMVNATTGAPHTAHTSNPVPLLIQLSSSVKNKTLSRSEGGLKDVAPTILDLMGIEIPSVMTGTSMVKDN